MPQNYGTLVALFFFAFAPAFADVVAVTVNGTVTGSGDVLVRCDSCETGAGLDGFNFAGSTSQLGTFSKSGQASFTDIGGRNATVSGLTEQATAASANSVSVDFLVSAIIDGVGAQWSAQADLSNVYRLGFTLTTASLMHLTASGGNEWFLSGGGGVEISSPFFGSFDQTFTVDPGSYTLTVSDMMHFGSGPQNIITHAEQTDRLSLTADFTSIVPEPRWAAILLAPLLILWHFVSRRRRRYTR